MRVLTDIASWLEATSAGVLESRLRPFYLCVDILHRIAYSFLCSRHASHVHRIVSLHQSSDSNLPW